ncbi:hypothetical protein ACIGEP_06160 [Microbacterium sp. NPDC077663]|uniref:hypothetical protein n=1 Tax=Microbacterium sp. NPDC077663 TaxID=3364189 RepID=UPI0037CBDC87
MDPRPGASLGIVNMTQELTYLRAGAEPTWERVWRSGKDVTDSPEMWSPYERERRLSFEHRVRTYRADGLL